MSIKADAQSKARAKRDGYEDVDDCFAGATVKSRNKKIIAAVHFNLPFFTRLHLT